MRRDSDEVATHFIGGRRRGPGAAATIRLRFVERGDVASVPRDVADADRKLIIQRDGRQDHDEFCPYQR